LFSASAVLTPGQKQRTAAPRELRFFFGEEEKLWRQSDRRK
jgi:hypothetical protein